MQRTTELYTAPHSEVAPFQRVWNPDTNNVYEDPDDWPKESDDDDTITKDELYVAVFAPADACDSRAALQHHVCRVSRFFRMLTGFASHRQVR